MEVTPVRRSFKKGFSRLQSIILFMDTRWAVQWGPFIEADISDQNRMEAVFEKYKPVAVMHFAAFAYVGESVCDPQKYYLNNVAGTLKLLEVMRKYNCKKIIFSSTCSTYGNPQKLSIDESHSQNPINPYGKSKLMIEQILADYRQAYGIDYTVLRYFNAAGADRECQIGESHNPETHLIPLAIDSALGGGSLLVYGDDYDTTDGTAMRDFVHVSDIASAHCLSLQSMLDSGVSECFNLGTGKGYSVLEVIKTVEKISGKPVIYSVTNRRPGDPPSLVAEAQKIRDKLSWSCDFSDLESIVETAWRWGLRGDRETGGRDGSHGRASTV